MKELNLITIFVNSRAESDDEAWPKISKFIEQNNIDIFSPFKSPHGFKHDPLIYFAINLCKVGIVKKLLEYSKKLGKKLDLNYHRIDLGAGSITKQSDKVFEWNVLQHAVIFNDLAIVRALCDYAKENKENPADIINAPIIMYNGEETFVGELMVGSVSFQATSYLDAKSYSLEERKELGKKLNMWISEKDKSLESRFNKDNPLKLKWYGRKDVFEYLINNEYINLTSITNIGKTFDKWLETVCRSKLYTSALIDAHSTGTVREINVVVNTGTTEGKEGAVTATGVLLNVYDRCPIHIEVDVELQYLYRIVAESVAKKIEESKTLLHSVRRSSFERVKKQVDETPKNRHATFNNRADITESAKKSYNTVYKRIYHHIMARVLTTTKLLKPKPVTRDAQIGKMIQTAFEVATSAIPGSEFANILPTLTKMVLEYNTNKKAKEQSETVFQATLQTDADSVCTSLAEVVTAMIVKEYGNEPDIKVAEYIAKSVITAIDSQLEDYPINNDSDLFAFLLAYANEALTKSLTLKQFKEIRAHNSDTTSIHSDKSKNSQQVNEFLPIENGNQKRKHGGCCSIS